MAPMPIGHDKLVKLVIELAQRRKLYAVHFRWAYTSEGRRMTSYQGDGAGYPDILIVGPNGPAWREIKTTACPARPWSS